MSQIDYRDFYRFFAKYYQPCRSFMLDERPGRMVRSRAGGRAAPERSRRNRLSRVGIKLRSIKKPKNKKYQDMKARELR